MGLSRFFCLSSPSGAAGRDEWARRSSYGEPYAGDGSFQAKVLEIIEEDLDHRLGGANFALQNVGSVPLRRMYNAGLPPAGMHFCKELLGKIAALDHAREAAEEERAQLAQALKAAEHSHRQAEFSRAKAEALATARGEALMHAQQATKEAQREQAALSEMLKQALQQLGMAITPGRSPAGTPEGSLLTYDQHSVSPMVPLAFSQQTPLQASAAAPSPVPQPQQQPIQQHPTQQQQQQQQQGRARDLRLSLDSVNSLLASREFSGFTVYTNRLHGSADLGEVAAPAAAQTFSSAEPAVEAEGEGSGAAAQRRSGMPWRDISSAVEASLSVEFDTLSGGDSTHRGSGGGSAEAAAALAALQPAGPETRQAQIQRMARLVLPTLDASQLDSLVRIGSSLPSPDMLMSPEVLSQLLPRLWDNSADEGAAPEMQELIAQLHSQQAAAAAAAGSAAAAAAAAQGRSEAGGAAAPAAAAAATAGRPGGQQGLCASKAPRLGTWLSPLKVGHPAREEGAPTPSPQSHIKAVFKDEHDIQFYLPFSAGLQKPNNAAKEEYRTRAALAAAVVPAPPATLPQQGPLPSKQTAAGPASRPASASLPVIRSSFDLQAAQQAQAQAAQQQRSESSLQQSQHSSALTGASSKPGSAAGSVRGSRDSVVAPAQPAGRKQAFLSRFQPMGMSAAASASDAPAQQAPAPAAQALAGIRASSLRRSASIGENLCSAAAAAAAAAGGGHRRRASGEGWPLHKAAAGTGEGTEAKQQGQAGYARASLEGGQPAALIDSTNASDSYLQRLAQQRAQQVYVRSAATASQFRR